jgi:hypothetical protein
MGQALGKAYTQMVPHRQVRSTTGAKALPAQNGQAMACSTMVFTLLPAKAGVATKFQMENECLSRSGRNHDATAHAVGIATEKAATASRYGPAE